MESTKVSSLPVSTIMTKDIYKVTAESKLKEANRIFTKHKIRHLPVVDGEKLVGIVSLTDVQRLSFSDSYNDDDNVDASIADMLSVGQIMKQHPVTVSSGDPILKAAKILADAEFHALPVIDHGNLVGIVTTTDIIKYLISRF